MLKYQLCDYFSVHNFKQDYVKEFLKVLGINRLESFLGDPNPADEITPYFLTNLRKGLEILKQHLDENKKIMLIVDPDPDGFTSSSILYNYIKQIKPDANLHYYLHTGKEHGVIVDTIGEDIDLVIIPDAGSNQDDDLDSLLNQGKAVVVIDHHIVDSKIQLENDNFALINNQASAAFDNKDLTGAGMVLKFIQGYDQTYGYNYSGQYYDLAALGIISDMAYSGNLDNNYIITNGLRHIRNPYFAALLEKQSFSITSATNPTKIDIAFYITPVINGVIRVGTQENKDLMFRALTDTYNTEIFTQTVRGEIRQETLFQKAAREAVNLRAGQNRTLDRILENIYEVIEDEQLYNNQIIIYKTSLEDQDEIPKTLTGLLAMKIVAKYNKPALVLRPRLENGEQYWFGSGRGKTVHGFNSLKKFLESSGLVEYASGHDNAHGVGIKESNIEPLIEYANETLKDIDFGSDTVDVFGIFDQNDMNISALWEFADYEYLYGNGIPQPMFAFELVIPKTDVKIIGNKASTIKWKTRGVTFIAFNAKDTFQDIEECETKMVHLTIIGRPQINQYFANKELQVKIMDISVSQFETVDTFLF